MGFCNRLLILQPDYKKEHVSIPGNTLLSILYAFYNSFIFLLRTYDLARNRTAGCCLWRSQIDLYLGCSHTA